MTTVTRDVLTWAQPVHPAIATDREQREQLIPGAVLAWKGMCGIPLSIELDYRVLWVAKDYPDGIMAEQWTPAEPLPVWANWVMLGIKSAAAPAIVIPPAVLCERCDRVIINHGGHWRHAEGQPDSPCPRACPPGGGA